MAIYFRGDSEPIRRIEWVRFDGAVDSFDVWMQADSDDAKPIRTTLGRLVADDGYPEIAKTAGIGVVRS